MNIDNALAAILAANVNQNIENTQDDMSLDECCKKLYILYKKYVTPVLARINH